MFIRNFFCLLLHFSTTLIKAQDAKNVITLELLGIYVPSTSEYKINLGYERVLSPKFTAYVGLEKALYNRVMEKTGAGADLREGLRRGYAFLLEGRYYPFTEVKTAPRRFFVGAYFQNHFIQQFIVDHSPDKFMQADTEIDRRISRGVGLDIGYKSFNGPIIFETLFGLARCWDNGIRDNQEIYEFIGIFPEKIFPRLGLRLGVAF